MSKKSTAFYQSHVEAQATRMVKDFQDKLESLPDESAAFALLGLSRDKMDDPVEIELMQARLLLQQTSLILTNTLALNISDDDMEAIGADAKAPTIISIERTPERILSDLYDNSEPKYIGSILARPGAVESIQGETRHIVCHHFDDGSMIARIANRSGLNDDLLNSVIDGATSASQILKADKAKNLEEPIQKIIESFEKEDFSAAARAQFPALVSKTVLGIAQTISKMPQIVMPVAETKDLMELIRKSAHEEKWKEGVTVTVDGQSCKTPADVERIFGVDKPITLEEAMARLRKPADASADAVATPATPRGRKPRA